jgi:hypothetical protein
MNKETGAYHSIFVFPLEFPNLIANLEADRVINEQNCKAVIYTEILPMFTIHILVMEVLSRLILGEEFRALIPGRQAKFQVHHLA